MQINGNPLVFSTYLHKVSKMKAGEGNSNPLQYSCLENPMGLKDSDTTKRVHFHFHALEKEMATHSSALAWRILGSGQPDGLPSLGSHRV